MIKVSMVPTEHVVDLWEEVKPHLQKAAEYTLKESR